jgi:single-strand DNA-binding protein
MLNDTIVTLAGHVGGDVVLRPVGDSVVAHFRVACTPRKLRRSTNQWVDGPTQWYGVTAWRQLAEHCGESLRRGDPVVVHGRIQANTYINKAGLEVTTLDVDALTVGHDLNRGVSHFSRPLRAAPAETVEAPAA